MKEKITGHVQRVRFSNQETGFTIGQLDDGTPFKGNVLAREGDLVELVGEWHDDPKWGRQFVAKSGTVKLDESPDAIAELLANRKEFKGIGAVRAERIVKAAVEFSSDGDVATGLLEASDEIAQAAGVPIDAVINAAKIWNEERDKYNALSALVDQGWTNSQASTIMFHLDEGAAGIVAADPYSLIGLVPRFGFRTVDAVAQKMGLKANDPRRMQAGVAYCLDQIASNGDTWTTREGLVDNAMQELRPDTLEAEDLILSALDTLISLGMVYTDTSPAGDTIVADTKIADAEFDVFARLIDGLNDTFKERLITTGARTQAAIEPLNAGQREALLAAARWPMSVISGAGGTGKTFTMRAICEMAEENKLRVALCAPTGKAARKLAHATGRPASTIHRLLEPRFDERTGGFRFLRSAGKPVEFDMVVVDEVSMCDVKLMRSLLHGLPKGCRLLLVGDHNQIPPVGAGAILRDLLAGGKSVQPGAIKVLTEIVRQAGVLARNTRAVLDGVVPPAENGSTTWQVHTTDRRDEDGTAGIAAKIVEMIVTAPQPLQPFGRHLDLDWDVQVLAPMRKGPMGTYALNVQLQKLRQRLLGNPDPDPTEQNKPPKPLVGDRVIWTKNDYELNIMNGTQAIVLGFAKGGVMELFTEDGREVDVPAAKRVRVDVAYAMTIHKSQGSEWPFVLLVAGSPHWIMHDRNLLYTGCSRAAESLMILGDWPGLKHFAKEQKTKARQTFGAFLVHGWSPTTTGSGSIKAISD